MKKLLLCAAAVLCVAASIFGGYYYYVTNDLHESGVQPDQMLEVPEATDREIPRLYRSGAWLEEDGSMNPNGLANAIAQRDHYLAQHMPPDGFGDNGVARLPQQFFPMGPQNLGGRTETILLHPEFTSNQTMWAGGASGGVWISSNGGNTWNAVNGVLGNFNVSCLALDPADPEGKTLYAGTGALDLRGDGIFRSTDGGMNWVGLPVTHNRGWKHVSSIAVANDTGDPVNTIILAAMQSDSTNELADHGIMRSDDGGLNWTQVINEASFGTAVAFDPNDSSKAVASTCTNGDPGVPGDPGKCKAWYSIDGGQTWSESYLETTLFESPRVNDSIHFAFRATASGTTIYAQYGDARVTVMSRSTNGGRDFSSHGMAGNPEGINMGVPAFWVSPPALLPPESLPDSPVIITGGANLFRSTNNAQTFETNPIANGAPLVNPVNPHVDMQTVVTDRRGGTNKKVFVATDGGIYHTEDITTAKGALFSAQGSPISTPNGWTAQNNRLQNTQYFSVAGEASSPGSSSALIFGGTMDNGCLRLVAGSTDTVNIWGGDGGASAVDGGYCFGQSNDERGDILRFNNCANIPPGPGAANVVTRNIPEHIGGILHLTQFIIDTDPGPNNTNANHYRAFVGANAVWKTNNVKIGQQTWTPIKANHGIPAGPTGTPEMIRPRITAMALAPSDSNYMWVGETYAERIEFGLGDLWRTENALGESPAWTKVDDNIIGNSLPLPRRQITKILIDQDSPAVDDIVYVAFGGFDDDNLWRTTNRGDSWEDISGGVPSHTCLPNDLLVGLPCAPIRALARHPLDPNTLYAGTEIGIYVTYNLNEPDLPNIRWSPVMQGPANVSIDDLTFMKNSSVLLAGTWGRGLWATNFAPNPSPTGPATVNDFDGDGRSDVAVVREDTHLVWHKQGSTAGYSSTEFGARDDSIAPADYDGDGKTDVAVYRSSEHRFYCLLSSNNTLATTQLGENGYALPASGDFDGDDLADEAVWDPFTGIWKVEQSENGHLEFQWGAPGDSPVTIDMDGNGQADFGVFHEENGMITFYCHAQSGDYEKQFGLEGDFPVPGDYDGDNQPDMAVWRPDDDGEGNGAWYISYAATNYNDYEAIPWGVNGDIPVRGDYDGDGKLDIAVWRPSDGMWHMLQSSNGYYSERFGADGDTPVGIKAVYASRPSGGQFTRVPPNAMPRRRGRVGTDLGQDSVQ